VHQGLAEGEEDEAVIADRKIRSSSLLNVGTRILMHAIELDSMDFINENYKGSLAATRGIVTRKSWKLHPTVCGGPPISADDAVGW